MKKVLFGCVAVSVFITAVAFAEFEKKQTSVSPETRNTNKVVETKTPVNTASLSIPHSDENKTDAKLPQTLSPSTKDTPTPAPVRMYSESENNIQESFENYLYFQGLDNSFETDVQSDGNDFIITVKNPSDPNIKPHELRMVRIENFAGNPQYSITHTNFDQYKALTQNSLQDATLSMKSFAETLKWVPALKIITNRSIKAYDIILKSDILNLSIQSVVADLLAREKDDKMDMASKSDMTGITMQTPFFTLSIPHMVQDLQITGAELTGKQALQTLTSTYAQSSMSIPTVTVTSDFFKDQSIQAKIQTKAVLDQQLTMESNISNIKISGALLPSLPQAIYTKVTVQGVSKELLIAYINMQQQLNDMPDENTPEAMALSQKLVAAQNQILNNLSLKMDDISIKMPNGSIDMTGTIHYAEPAFKLKAQVAITNFDQISPPAEPINEAECRTALANAPVPQEGDIPVMPAACVQQSGALEMLRPYLQTAQHSQNDLGQPVDTFTIDYAANTLSINNEAVITPQTPAVISPENVDKTNNLEKNAQLKADQENNLSDEKDFEESVDTAAVNAQTDDGSNNAPMAQEPQNKPNMDQAPEDKNIIPNPESPLLQNNTDSSKTTDVAPEIAAEAYEKAPTEIPADDFVAAEDIVKAQQMLKATAEDQ